MIALEKAKSKWLVALSFSLILYAFPFLSSAFADSPVNPNASQEAEDVLNYLYDISGEHIVSGQYNYTDSPYYFDGVVHDITGKYAGLWGSDFAWNETASLRPGVVDAAIDHWENGNLVTLSWHASMPDAASDAGWDSVQGWYSDEDIEDVVTPGTTLYNEWQSSVDNIAGYLQDLEDADVPVLWRPFHEMNGGWFWWGGRPDIAKQLWINMYNRLVNYHHLDNLIWVWSPGAMDGMDLDDYYPGDDYVDVAALDIYDGFKQTYYDDLVDVANGKPIAIGECGPLPDVSTTKTTQPLYTYFMAWGSNLWDNSNSYIQDVYDDPYTLTLDELDLSSGSSGSWTGVDDQSSAISYSGYWTNDTVSGDYSGTEKYTNAYAASAEFAFTGSKIQYIGYKQDNLGIADIYIDGAYDSSVDLFNSGGTGPLQTVLYEKTGLSSGSHTIKIVSSGNKNSSSSDTYIVLDAFNYYN